MENGASSAAPLVLGELQRQLSRQEGNLDLMRTRALALLTVSAAVAALLAPRAGGGQGDVVLASIAVTFFALTGVCVAYILWPRDWCFAGDVGPHLQNIKANEPTALRDFAYNTGKDMQSWRVANQAAIERLTLAFALGCLLLAAQTIAWSIAAL